MKRVIATAICALLAVACTVPAAATSYKLDNPDSNLPAGTLIYYEDFDNLSVNGTDATLGALGWQKNEAFKDFTAILSAENGYLHIDNLDATVGESMDSYAYVLDEEYASQITGGKYTYQYDVTYRDAENTYRYLSILLNYDGMDNYNTVDMRIRGDGYNQYREGSSWVHYNDDDCSLGTHDDTAILTLLYGETFDENVMALKDRTVTVKVEVDPEKGNTVFINGVRVSEMEQNEDHWKVMTARANAIAFKTSTKLLADFDNFMIWAGNGVDANTTVLTPVVEEAPAEEVVAEEVAAVEAPAEETPILIAPAPEAAKTADFGIAASVVLMACAAGVVLNKKKH